MECTDFWAFSRLAESSQQRNEESGHINEFETIFSVLMQRRFGREVQWDLLIFGFLQASTNSAQQRNEEWAYINEFETIFSVLMQRRFGREVKWDLLIFGFLQASKNSAQQRN